METNVDRFNADLVTECARLAQAELTLRKELEEASKRSEQQEQQIKELQSKLATARNNAELERLKVELITKQLFGSRSERRKLSESEFLNQLRFSFLVESEASEPEESEEAEEASQPEQKKKQKNREKYPNPTRKVRFPEHLPRSVIDVEPADKSCPCCAKTMTHKKEELITEKLCCSRDPFYVEQYRRPVYSCRDCERIAPVEPVPEVFKRTCLAESMVAFTLVGKFLYGLPFFRQAKMYTGWGVSLSDSLLVRHCLMSFDLLKPVISRHKLRVFRSAYLLADETRLRAALLNKKTNKTEYQQGYLWGAMNDACELYYEFTPSRTHAYCLSVFENYQGVVACDGYDGYETLAKQGDVSLAHCNYHARRKWHQALTYDKKRANQALDFYQALSEIEREGKDLPPDKRYELRQKMAVPVWEEFHEWLIAHCANEPKKTPIRKAHDYCRKRWSTLRAYLHDGNIPISTNELESKMKHIAVGRKNFIHAASQVGAEAVAGMYALVLTCELQGVDPFYYLADVLRRVGEHPASKVEELTPALWKEKFYEEARERYQSPEKALLK